jgi:hypothetical protein
MPIGHILARNRYAAKITRPREHILAGTCENFPKGCEKAPSVERYLKQIIGIRATNLSTLRAREQE